MPDGMTSRERLTAALHQRPVDHIPYDPRIWHAPTGTPWFDSMTDLKKIAYLECDRLVKLPFDQNPYHIQVRRPLVDVIVTRSRDEHVEVYRTRSRDLVSREAYRHGSWHPVEYPINTVEDVMAMRDVFAGSEYWVEPSVMEHLERLIESYGETALAATGYVTTPYMELVQRLAGLENLVFLLHDHPCETEELMALMHDDQLRKLRALLPHTSIEYVFSMENTTVDLVPPHLFRRHCAPQLSEYGKLIESYGKFHMLHMCGKIKHMLPDIEQIDALAIDLLSPPPVGDTTLADGVLGCPGKSIMGGTNVLWWLNSEERVAEMILEAIEQTGRRTGLVIQGPGSSLGVEPEKVRNVWRRVRAGLRNGRGS